MHVLVYSKLKLNHYLDTIQASNLGVNMIHERETKSGVNCISLINTRVTFRLYKCRAVKKQEKHRRIGLQSYLHFFIYSSLKY